MNGKTCDLSKETCSELLFVITSVLRANPPCVCVDSFHNRSSYWLGDFKVDRKEIVRILLFDHIDRILATLVNSCRYENMYGLSARSILIHVGSKRFFRTVGIMYMYARYHYTCLSCAL